MNHPGKELGNASGARLVSTAADGAVRTSATGRTTTQNVPNTMPQQHLPHALDVRTDPIEYLNALCPSEPRLLQSLPDLQEDVRDRLCQLDDAISVALSKQSESSEQTSRALPSALSSVKSLQHRVLLVKEKAIDSERAVLSITGDMKRLDRAKRHLQRTIATLKRLHMLVHAVEQLRQTTATTTTTTTTNTTAFEAMEYRSAAQLVEATKLLMEHFDAYTTKVEPMKLLSTKVRTYQELLTHNATYCFRIAAFGSQQAKELDKSLSGAAGGGGGTRRDNHGDDDDDDDVLAVSPTLNDAIPTESDLEGVVLLLDALGESARTKFVQNLCHDYLRTYVRDFEPPFPQQEVATKKRISSFKVTPADAEPSKKKLLSCLAEMEQRFVWFQDVLQTAKNTFRMVPPHWNLLTNMSRSFLQMTRSHILALLEGPRRDPDADHPAVLLKSIQKTLVFEKDLTAWLEKQCGAGFRSSGTSADPDDATSPAACEPLVGTASSAFENFMGPYLRTEEQSMDEQLAEALEDQSVDTRGERPVFISSTKLFLTIKGSITRCTALTTGKPFLQLYRSFQETLRRYSQVLDSKLPVPLAGGNTISGISIPGSFGQQLAGASGGGPMYRLSIREEVKVCHVISTCEYCVDTMEALEDLVRDLIDERHGGARVDMSSIQDAFYDVATKAIRVLVSGLTLRAESGLKHFGSANWGSWEAVGEESEYVRAMHEEIEPFVICVRSLLPTSYFRSFCDKFAASFSSLYYETLVKVKKISQPGTQQLLLDVYNLKTLFLKLPVADHPMGENRAKVGVGGVSGGTGGSTIAPAVYTKMVQSQFGKIETLLKLVGTPNDLLIENFNVQWPGGGTVADLQVILSLKGLKRVDQAPFVDKFGAESSSTSTNLASASAASATSASVNSAVLVSERVQAAFQDQGSSVAAKVNSDLTQMKLKVDDFRKTWRGGSGGN